MAPQSFGSSREKTSGAWVMLRDKDGGGLNICRNSAD